MNFYRIEYLAKYFSTASNITIFFSLYTFRVYKYIHEIYIRIIYIQIYIRRIVFLGMLASAFGCTIVCTKCGEHNWPGKQSKALR